MTDPLALSIVVPTFCERENVPELIRRLEACAEEVKLVRPQSLKKSTKTRS